MASFLPGDVVTFDFPGARGIMVKTPSSLPGW